MDRPGTPPPSKRLHGEAPRVYDKDAISRIFGIFKKGWKTPAEEAFFTEWMEENLARFRRDTFVLGKSSYINGIHVADQPSRLSEIDDTWRGAFHGAFDAAVFRLDVPFYQYMRSLGIAPFRAQKLSDLERRVGPILHMVRRGGDPINAQVFEYYEMLVLDYQLDMKNRPDFYPGFGPYSLQEAIPDAIWRIWTAEGISSQAKLDLCVTIDKVFPPWAPNVEKVFMTSFVKNWNMPDDSRTRNMFNWYLVHVRYQSFTPSQILASVVDEFLDPLSKFVPSADYLAYSPETLDHLPINITLVQKLLEMGAVLDDSHQAAIARFGQTYMDTNNPGNFRETYQSRKRQDRLQQKIYHGQTFAIYKALTQPPPRLSCALCGKKIGNDKGDGGSLGPEDHLGGGGGAS